MKINQWLTVTCAHHGKRGENAPRCAAVLAPVAGTLDGGIVAHDLGQAKHGELRGFLGNFIRAIKFKRVFVKNIGRFFFSQCLENQCVIGI